MNNYIEAIETAFYSQFKDLFNHELMFKSLLFWLIVLIVFFLLIKIWSIKKALTFTLISTSVLYLMTILVSSLAATEDGPIFSSIVVLGSYLFIVILFMVYYFLK